MEVFDDSGVSINLNQRPHFFVVFGAAKLGQYDLITHFWSIGGINRRLVLN